MYVLLQSFTIFTPCLSVCAYCLYTSAIFAVISCEEFSDVWVCKSVHKNKPHCSEVLQSSFTHKQPE